MGFGREEVERAGITRGSRAQHGVWRVKRSYVRLCQGPMNYGAQVKSSPLPIFENKILLGYGDTCLFV